MENNPKLRNDLLRAGVRNLKEFGYPDVTTANILTDYIFKKFFSKMLEEALEVAKPAQAHEIRKLLEETQ